MKLSQMAGAHIKPIAALKQRRDLVIDVWGPEGSGKTAFAASAAGKNGLFYQTLEVRRSNDTILKAAAGLKPGELVVGEYESEVPPSVNRDNEGAVKSFFQPQLQRFKNDMNQALKLGAGAIAWDKGIDLWELIRYSHFGKLLKVMQLKYGPANSEFVDLVSLPARSGASLIMINEEEDEWVDGPPDPTTGKVTRQSSGKKVRRAQDKTGYLTDVSLRMYKVVKPKLKFYAEIVECKPAPEYIGLVMETPTFAEVASLVRPEISW